MFFADSYSSWQKVAIENANKLIRKYIPQKSNFEKFSDKRILNIQKKLNRRPREKLNFDSPKTCFFNMFYNFEFAVGINTQTLDRKLLGPEFSAYRKSLTL